jgi:hypothetical protein
VVGCPPSPLAGCQTSAKVQIQVNEKTPGKEQIKVKIDRLASALPLSFFGDPVNGNSGYAVCIYNQANARVATLRVNRPQQMCGTRLCWKIAGGTSYKYSDKLLSSDGMLQLQMKSGIAGKGKVVAKGKNNAPKGLTALPTGVAAQMAGNTQARVQLMSSHGACVTGTVINVKDALSNYFKGQTP